MEVYYYVGENGHTSLSEGYDPAVINGFIKLGSDVEVYKAEVDTFEIDNVDPDYVDWEYIESYHA